MLATAFYPNFRPCKWTAIVVNMEMPFRNGSHKTHKDVKGDAVRPHELPQIRIRFSVRASESESFCI